MSNPEPRPAVPLEYEPPAPRRRQMIFALVLVAIVLAVVVVGGLLFFGIASTQTVQVVVSAPVPGQLPVPGQEQMKSTLLPPEGMEMTLKQRETRWLAGARLKLSIDDITNGQVLISISDDAEQVLVGPKSVREGDELQFLGPDGAPMTLEVLKLRNILIGDDLADFRLLPAKGSTRPALSEAQKIELLLTRIAASSQVVFIRNGSEHSPHDAADHLRSKWESSGGPENVTATAQDFIEQVGSRSSISGLDYRVRLPDGSEMTSAQWLREQLREIEEPSAATTRATPRSQPRANGEDQSAAMLTVDCTGGSDLSCDDETMNLALPTLGGKQLWTDVRIDPTGWRIQRHALTGHYRLIDGRNIRRAWGKRDHCEEAWARLAPPPNATARSGRELVVLLHGLGRTRSAMAPMASFFRGAGYDVVDFGYASTRAGIDHHADALDSVLDGLQGYDRIHFVGHSLGALVVRRYLALHAEEPGSVGRVVMLAPPNQGSALAARLRANPVFLAAAGPVGQEIGRWRELAQKLATPVQCAVIAGECRSLSNPLLDGSGDLVVTVEETKLEGMQAFLCIDATHTFLMNNPAVMRQSLAFVRQGRFE